jgi:hypothetical protein
MFVKLITWLGGATAALGLVTGVTGYLALGAFDDALGIPELPQDKLQYMVIGGLFFSRTLLFVLAAFFSSWMAWIILLCLILLQCLVMAERWWDSSLGGMVSRLGIGVLFLALIACIALLSGGLGLDASYSGSAQVEYGLMALVTAGLAVIAVRLEQELSSDFHWVAIRTYRRLRIPILAFMLMFAFLLPRAYGVMTLQRSFPEILEMHYDAAQLKSGELPQAPLLLIRRSSDRLVLFGASTGMIVLDAKSVTWMKLGANKLLP